MKNNLKYQLGRIQRLMETKKPSSKNNINESSLGIEIKLNGISDLMKYFGVSKDEVIQDIERSGLKDSERIAESFDNLLQTSIQNLTDEEYKFVSAIVRRVFPSVIKNFENELKNLINSKQGPAGLFDKLITNLKTDKMTPQQFIDYMRKIYNVVIPPEALLIYDDFLKNLPTSIINLPEGYFNKLSYYLGLFWKTGVVESGKDFWDYLKEEIGHLGGPTFLNYIMGKLKMEYTGTIEKNLKPLEQKMLTEYDMIIKKIELGQNGDFTKELENLNNLLLDYRIQKVKASKNQFDTFLNELKKNPKFKRLFNPEDPYYYKKWYSDHGESEFYVKLMDGYEKSEKILPTIEITTSKIEGAKKLLGGLNPFNKQQKFEFSRIFNLLLIWSPRSFEEAAKNRNILGNRKWIIKGIVQKVVFTVFVVGFYYSLIRVTRDFIFAGINKWRIDQGKEPYKYFEEITDEEFQQVNQSNSNWLAAFKMAGNFWMSSLSFIGTDATKVSFWSPAATIIPYINNAVREILNPTRNILPSLKAAKPDVMRSEINALVNDTTSNVNGNANVKKFTDSMGLKIMSADTIINTADQKISELVK